MQVFDGLLTRFAGVDIKYRKRDPKWPYAWCAKLVVHKNEREDYRIEVHASTMVDAMARLIEAVDCVDRAQQRAAVAP